MEFDAIPYEVADVDERALASYASRGQPMLVILAASRDGKDTTELGRLIDAYGLRSLERPPGPPRPADRYGMYRFDPALAGQRPAPP